MSFVNLLLAGWTALALVFLYVPVVVLVGYSFNQSKLNLRWTGFTLHWYVDVWKENPLIQSLWNSVWIALWTTLISVILGTLGAWLLHRYRFRGHRLIQTLAFVPMVMPEIIMGVSLMIFFATLGIPRAFFTVISSHVTFCFPFVMVAVDARLRGLDPSLEEAAMDLGATPARAFWLVILPYLLPAIVSSALMAFTLSMDELIVTYFTSGVESKTLPIKIYDEVKKSLNPMLYAISAMFIVATAILVVAANRIGQPKHVD